MKTFALVLVSVALLGSAEPLATDRRVHGVITAVEPAALTIATEKHAVSGRIDPKRTRVTVSGKTAKSSDLHITARAKGELGLDDVWLVVDAH